jgi:threonine synthase
VLASGRYEVTEVVPTLSPSMDIQVASNFERLLFELYEGDGAAVTGLMAALATDGAFEIEPARLETARGLFVAHHLDDAGTEAEIGRVYRETGMMIDPHSAIGVAAGRACRGDASVPMIALGTAHPSKFPEAVERATGVRPELPAHLADIYDRPEYCQTLPNDLATVMRYIRGVADTGNRTKGAA